MKIRMLRLTLYLAGFLSQQIALQAQWVKTDGPYGGFIRCFAVSDTNLFAGTDGGGVFLSTNNGTNWTEVSIGSTKTEVRALAAIGTNLFAGTSGGGVFVSTNNGTSWTEVNTGLTNTDVRAFAVIGSNLFAGTEGGGVFLSTDNGTSWTANSKGLTYLYVKAFTVSGTNLFVATTALWGFRFGGGIYLLIDNSTKWTGVNTGLTDTGVLSLAANGSNLFVGTYFEGVWKRPLSEMIHTSVEEPLAYHRLPDYFSIDQNYPNPFNPATTIAFHLPASSFVTLKVFNSAGRVVASLVDRQLPAGNHTAEWNASGVPSGVYFYRIQAGTYSETKKLVVTK